MKTIALLLIAVIMASCSSPQSAVRENDAKKRNKQIQKDLHYRYYAR